MLPTLLRARRPLAAALALALIAPSALRAAEPPLDDPAVQPAEILPLASRALLLDLVRASAGIFAVGERGIVLRGDGNGAWTQLPVPTRTALTSVASADGELWVAGHSGLILRSSDNGDTWTRQRVDVWDPQSFEPSQGAPILDLLFVDANKGFAVGAFAKLLRTVDGGQTWVELSLKSDAPTLDDDIALGESASIGVDEEDAGFDASGVLSADELMLDDEVDPHLNAIARDADGNLYLAGERGAMFRSRDNGDSWQRLDFPYEGSMFGVMAWGAGQVLAFGLRGHVFESTDGGESWSQLDTATQVALMGGTALPNGGAVIVGNEGTILRRADAASPFERITFQNADGETPVLSGAIPDDAGGLILIGEKGADRHGAR